MARMPHYVIVKEKKTWLTHAAELGCAMVIVGFVVLALLFVFLW